MSTAGEQAEVTRPVVVGVDGSAESRRAVSWAADTARRVGSPLLLVHAWVWPLYHVDLGPVPGAPAGSGLQAQAEQILADAVGAVRAAETAGGGGLVVATRLVTGAAAPQLVGLSHDARLLVVGSRGLGGFTGLLLGSVGVATTARAACPVVVVRGEETPGGPVVVGVDGSPASLVALAAAWDEAAARDAVLRVVHAWALPGLGSVTGRKYADLVRGAVDDAHALLDQAEAQVAAGRPAVKTERVLGDRGAAAELVDASQGAQLLAVGTHGDGALRGLLLGSTTQAVLRHAHCPVLVAR
jgi:nucleotide-binding universal stress UspA family protein